MYEALYAQNKGLLIAMARRYAGACDGPGGFGGGPGSVGVPGAGSRRPDLRPVRRAKLGQLGLVAYSAVL